VPATAARLAGDVPQAEVAVGVVHDAPVEKRW
jgi:hypothetical protein